MRRLVARFNFSRNLIGNRPQSLTGHVVKRNISSTQHAPEPRQIPEQIPQRHRTGGVARL